jgi:hypothetical protein
MRFIIMHKTNAHWEAGAIPGPELVARVGRLIGELSAAHVLHGAEGLRATSQGARLRFASGVPAVIPGPFEGDHELAAGFSIVRATSLAAAIDWATRQAPAGEEEVDIRPVTEPWDIGLGTRPADVETTRYMIVRKATAATEAGVAAPPMETSGAVRPAQGEAGAVTHMTSLSMRPSARGRRYKNSREGITFTDGPFTESKEMIAGYVVVSAASLQEADRWARRYFEAVGADEVELRELA